MQICQVKGHNDKMARTNTNTQNDTKTRPTLWRNRYLEILDKRAILWNTKKQIKILGYLPYSYRKISSHEIPGWEKCVRPVEKISWLQNGIK